MVEINFYCFSDRDRGADDNVSTNRHNIFRKNLPIGRYRRLNHHDLLVASDTK